MTPAKMFEGDLWVLASHSVQMAQNAYKNGQADEREACVRRAEIAMLGADRELTLRLIAAILARGQA
jgi:hypothetical protein